MSDLHDDCEAAELERHARDVFKASIDELDSATLSRLNQSRQQALAAAAGRHRSGWRWSLWAPVGALAAGVVTAALLLQSPSQMGLPVQVATTAASNNGQQDPLELLTAGEDLELATEADLEFYAWVALETTDDGDGVG
jgi:hypothetical protein